MRRALGFPISLYEKFFGEFAGLQGARRSTNSPLGNSTPYYMECEIAKEHQLTLGQYRKLPRRERYSWYLFRILESEKKEFAYEEMKRESESKSKVDKFSKFREYM